MSNTRDDSLDVIKGFCCLLMVIAHQPYFYQDPKVVLGLINYTVNVIPPVLFFSIAGVTTTFQATKYSLQSLAKYFVAMFFIGITWNIAIHGDISAFYWPEIFQLIALGSLCVCVIERNGPAPKWVLFLTGTCIVLIKPIADRLWPHFDGLHFLFCDRQYIPDVGLNSKKNAQIFPGFPLSPWAGYFILGVWSYRISKYSKLVLAIASLCLVYLSVTLGSSAIEKWDSSVAYIFANFTVMISFFWLFDGPFQGTSVLAKQLRKIGSNAFLFFFSHPLGLVTGVIFYAYFHNAYIAWSVAVAISILAYNFFSGLKPSKLFESGYAWFLMIGAIILIPFLPQLIKHPGGVIAARLLAITLGAIAAINFSSLSKLTKVRKLST